MTSDANKMSGVELRAKHQHMVYKLWKPGEEIMQTITPERLELLHGAIGMATEACEIADAIKAHVIYNKPLDMENIEEELGDLEFFMEAFRQVLRIEREYTLLGNIEKLGKRYKDHEYSDEQARNRADKQEN